MLSRCVEAGLLGRDVADCVLLFDDALSAQMLCVLRLAAVSCNCASAS